MTTHSPSTVTEGARRARRDPRFRRAVDAGPVVGGNWRDQAACLHRDPELFFPTAAEDPSPALAICRSCPVQGLCLAAALETGECDGVWGATTPDERRVMRQAWTRETVRTR
jgi:hypothetical protein